MYPTSKRSDYRKAKEELDAAIVKKKAEAAKLEEALRHMPMARRRARALRGVWFGSFGAGGFMTLLIGGAYAGLYVEPLRQFWYIWPSVGMAADVTKLGLIWVVCLVVAMSARTMRRRALRAAVARLDKGIEDL